MSDVDRLSELLHQTVEAVFEAVSARRSSPTGTYRLQFHEGFTFRQAAAIVPYLRALGVSHVYASPYFRARPGSRHGYDVCDYNQLNPEIGTEEDYQLFTQALAEHGLAHIADMVPNHMYAGQENAWWRDVLENGPNSPYSGYFDIDWKPVKTELENRVLIPILGAQYGDVLENGQLQIEHADGGFQVRYFQHLLPFGPKTAIPILTHHLDTLRERLGADSEDLMEYQSIITSLEHLPPPTATSLKAVLERQREKEVVKRRLRDLELRQPAVAEFVAGNVAYFNGRPGEAESFDRLDKLLQLQSYRLCHWRAADDIINYRRFFDVNDLAATCVEKPEVFQAAHGLVGRLLGDDSIAGLRIDHVDGLFAPEDYLWRLQWLYLAHIARHEFRKLVDLPADSATLGLPVTIESPAEATAEAGEGGVAVASPSTQTCHLGPEVLRRICARLNLKQPTAADIAAVFGPRTGDGARVFDFAEGDAATTAEGESPEAAPPTAAGPLYVVVEKILGPDEPLPETWPVAGTTGYDYAHYLNGLFVVAEGRDEIERQYRRFTGEKRSFAEVVHDCKRLILRFSMSSELQMLAHRLSRISEQHRKTRDFTLNTLRYALREVLTAFSVYRTYPGPNGVSERDRRFVNRAVAVAKRRNRAMDPATYDFIRDLLLLRHPPGLNAEALRLRDEFAGRFQQVTSPTMAKGVEDTAFYVYSPLLSINEVGGHPESAAVRPQLFHAQNEQRSARQRGGLLATTTHDTKRSEDVRARVNVLTEMPQAWRTAVNRWSRLTRSWKQDVEGAVAPSREDEYLFYQTLAGMWPVGEVDDNARAVLIERLQIYMEKATREAKQRTSWINPHAEYDQAVRQFVAKCLDGARDNRFFHAFRAFQRRIVNAGYYTALSQVVLKLTSPGVPDVYQGQELWDDSLVDPDNRRPVDYQRRAALLEQVRSVWDQGSQARQDFATHLAQHPDDQRLKLFVTWRLLNLRRERLSSLDGETYTPLECSGAQAEHLVAFAWRRTEDSAPDWIVVAPRWWVKLARSAGFRDVTEAQAHAEYVWDDTEIVLPAGFTGSFTNAFTDEVVDITEPQLRVNRLLARFPVAVLLPSSQP